MTAIDSLKREFVRATDYIGYDFEDEFFNSEFSNWLFDRTLMLGDYLDLLAVLGVSFDNLTTAEVGKTPYDSAVLPFRTSIITSYDKDFENEQNIFGLEERLHFGDMVVYNSIPRIVYYNKKDDFVDLYSTSVNTFMTQNPASIWNIYNWEKLHNSGLYDIILGVYGNNYDIDKTSKIKMLSDFKNSLIRDTYKECYYEFDDEYFYVVASDNGRKKVLTR